MKSAHDEKTSFCPASGSAQTCQRRGSGQVARDRGVPTIGVRIFGFSS